MRIAILLLVPGAFELFAAATRPSVEQSAAVLTGTIVSAEKVGIETNRFNTWEIKREIWRAEIIVQRIIKEDTKLPERVFLYYEKDHVGEDSMRYGQACPGQPRIVVGDAKLFYCIRTDAGRVKSVLFIPERGWVTTQ